jgi:hypothetical protein
MSKRKTSISEPLYQSEERKQIVREVLDLAFELKKIQSTYLRVSREPDKKKFAQFIKEKHLDPALEHYSKSKSSLLFDELKIEDHQSREFTFFEYLTKRRNYYLEFTGKNNQ